jgi:hypothetical protein
MKLLFAALERARIVSAAFGRLVVIGLSSFGLATVANWQNHQGYWHGTIVRVQTTDFNLLSHMLPTKLSYTLLQGNIPELQRTLDSNFGLFGLVVTDCSIEATICPGQRILYTTTSKLSWRENLHADHLLNHPYDFLRNPPPLVAEGKFDNARDLSRSSTGRTNSGRIVGRVYYVRSSPPLFRTAYQTWLQMLPGSLLSNRSAERYYSLTLILFAVGGVVAWGFIEQVFQGKRLQKRLALQEQTQLLKEAQNLQQQLQDQLQRQNALLTELEQYRRQQARLIQNSQREIAYYESRLTQKQQEQQSNTDALIDLQRQLQAMQQQHVQGQEQLAEREHAIALLEHQIARQKAENDRTDESLNRLQDDLQLTRQQASAASARICTLDQSISAVTAERDLAVQKAQQLEQNLRTAQTQAARSATLAKALESREVELTQLQHRAQELEEVQAYVVQENEQLSDRIQTLTQVNEQLAAERDSLQVELWNSKDQLIWFRSNWISATTPTPPHLQPIGEPFIVDLSDFSLALVGGRPPTRQEVFAELSEHYGLQKHRYVEVPPIREKNINRSRLKEKISGRDLIAVIVTYIGHDLTDMVSELKESGALSGEIIWVNESGKTGIVRSILAHITQTKPVKR